MDTKALRQKVLDLAIRGKLVPQDPNDEPASVLLERIRQQKQQMVKDGKLKAKDIKNDTIIFVGEDNLHYEKFADGSVKCIEDEIPFELPDGWAWTRVNQIYNFIDYRGATPNKITSGVPLITAKNVKSGYIDYTIDEYISEEEYWDRQQRGTSRLGDILFTTEAPLGNAAIADVEKFSAGQRLITFQHYGDCALNNHTFLYFILSDSFQGQLHTRKTGSTVAGIKAAVLKTLLLPVPPIAEQAIIGEKCKSLLALIEEITNSKQDIISVISKTKSKILDLAIRGQLVPQDPADEPASVLLERIRAEKEEHIKQGKIKRDKKESVIFRGEDNSYYEKIGGKVENISDEIPFELPEGWAWCRGYSCFVGMESTKPQGDFFNYIDIDAIDNRLHRIKEAKHLPVSDAPSRASRAVKAGSVLFSLVRPYLENIALVEEKHSNCIASTGFYVCNSNGVLLPEFMFFLMISGYVANGLNQYMNGDNSPSIRKDNIENWLYPVPPLEEQQAICAKLQSAFSLIENVEKSLS